MCHERNDVVPRRSTLALDLLDNETLPLWIHTYSGRENGLMIVGDCPALEALGRQLMEAAPVANADRFVTGWPPKVAAPPIIGAYRDLPGFQLSFHLKGEAPLDTLLPLRRRTLWTPLWLAVALCAVTGAVNIARWLVSLAF